jgi:hypothetical protein
MQAFVQQVVKEIVTGVRELDPVCQRMFDTWIAWL